MAERNGGYLHVKNWAKFQHYKNRSPTWIKLYRNLLQDYHFRKLPDRCKLQLVLIWLLAASHDGMVPNDREHLRNVLGLSRGPDLDTLINQGFLTENASIVLAQRERREDKRREEESKPVDKSKPKGQQTAEQLEALNLAKRSM